MKEALRARAAAMVLLALAAAALWAGILLALRHTQQSVVQEAQATRASLARSLAEYEGSSVRAIDMALTFLRDGWRGDAAAFDAAARRYEPLLHKENVTQIAVLDAEGWLRYSRLPQPSAVNFADREYFRAQRAAVTDALHVSEPVMGRVTGQWSIQFSRRMVDEEGRFAGVIVVAVPPPALERVYRDVVLDPADVVVLARTDGRVLARNTQFERSVTISIADAAAFRPGAGAGGEFQWVSKLDGIERFYTYRRVDAYPLLLLVGQKVEGVLAPYHRQRAYLIGGGVIASALLAWLGLMLLYRTRDQQRFEEEHATMMRELHDGCIQSAYAVGLALQDCRSLMATDRSRVDHVIAQAEAELSLVIQELRAFISGERRRALTVDEFVAEIERASPLARRPALSIVVDPTVAGLLSADQQRHLLRIVREVSGHVMRPAAEAARSSITLARRQDPDLIRLEIADEARAAQDGEGAPAGLGVAHIHSRARKLHGSASVTSEAAAGMRVVVEFPGQR